MNENKFDIYEPLDGHEVRFLQKLSEQKVAKKPKKRSLVRKIIYGNIVAAMLIMVALVWCHNSGNELEKVSQVAYESEQYYLPKIQENIEIIKNSSNRTLAQNALNELKKMQVDYEQLRKEIIQQGQNQHLITAIQMNFNSQLAFSNHVIGMM